MLKRVLALMIALFVWDVRAWKFATGPRTFLKESNKFGERISKAALSLGLLPLLFATGAPVHASEEVPVYFGVGCFWHVQHEFVQAEKKLLGRTDDTVTVRIMNVKLFPRYYIQLLFPQTLRTLNCCKNLVE